MQLRISTLLFLLIFSGICSAEPNHPQECSQCEDVPNLYDENRKRIKKRTQEYWNQRSRNRTCSEAEEPEKDCEKY